MLKSDLINDINTVLSYFESSTSDMGSTIYDKYDKLKHKLLTNGLKFNPIKGSVRAYLDAFNNWDNPILVTMGDLETRIELIIDRKDVSNTRVFANENYPNV